MQAPAFDPKRRANAGLDGKNEAGSPPRKGRNSHSEQTDEAPPGLIENEQVEIERKFPQMTISRSSNRAARAAEPPVFED
jgi:hypothetical protein